MATLLFFTSNSLSSIKTRVTLSDFNAPKIYIMWNSMD